MCCTFSAPFHLHVLGGSESESMNAAGLTRYRAENQKQKPKESAAGNRGEGSIDADGCLTAEKEALCTLASDFKLPAAFARFGGMPDGDGMRCRARGDVGWRVESDWIQDGRFIARPERKQTNACLATVQS